MLKRIYLRLNLYGNAAWQCCVLRTKWFFAPLD